MFAKEYRLDRAIFTRAYRRGTRVDMSGIVLIYDRSPSYRVAVVVGKKVAQSAVARNRLRRRLYEALHDIRETRGHIIIVAKRPAQAYSYARLATEVKAALDRAHLGSRGHSR